jgi:catechol 2,3-dioxygenase
MKQEKPMPFTIDSATTIGHLTLAVKNLEEQRDFYLKVIGLTELDCKSKYVDLGIPGKLILRLKHCPDGIQYPHAPGLFHLAIRLPGPETLGQWLKHLRESHYPLGGAGDHLVSEALYLTDPEGNGIEIYYDRPQEVWEYDENSIKMDTLAVDLESLLEKADDRPFAGLPPGSSLGHIHLRVNDVKKGVEFYQDSLGFQVMALWPGAGFLSAGGYHHHIGVNMWNSRGAQPAPADSLGLVSYTILLPTQKSLDHLLNQLNSLHQKVEKKENEWVLTDLSQNKIVLKVAEAVQIKSL